ncbi:MAG: hypothetical protein COC15_02405, partial [Legionellales bacterium]
NSLYTDKALAAIHATKDKRIPYNIRDNFFKNPNKSNDSIDDLLTINKIYLNGDYSNQEYLTLIEAKCWYNSLKNMSIQNSAIDLDLSYQTVQKYLNSVANKLRTSDPKTIYNTQLYLEPFLQKERDC